MSSKSAVKLVVPEGDESSLYRWVAILTGSKNALKGVGLLPRRPAADRWSASRPRWLILAGVVLAALLVDRAADARAPRPPRREGQVQAHVLQQPRGQRPRRRAHLPLRLARRLVRRRPPGLPRDRPRLELLADRRLPRDLGDRLRGRAGGGPAASCAAAARSGGAEPDGRTATWLAFVLARLPGRDRHRPHGRRRSDRRCSSSG